VPALASYPGLVFLDEFTDGPIAAGSVDGTSVPDGSGIKRAITDTTTGKISITADGKLRIAAGGTGYGNPGCYWEEADTTGIAFGAYFGLYMSITCPAKGLGQSGLNSDQFSAVEDPRFQFSNLHIIGETTTNGDVNIVPNYSVNTTYDLMLFQRGASSKFMFLLHNNGQVWDIKHTCDDNEASAQMFPVVGGGSFTLQIDALRVAVIDMSADFASDPFTGTETEVTLPFTLD